MYTRELNVNFNNIQQQGPVLLVFTACHPIEEPFVLLNTG